MSSEPEKKRVQFRTLRGLVDRADTLAVVFETDRTGILISALHEYLRDAVHSDEVKQGVTEAYYDDAIISKELKSLVGHEGAANSRLPKWQLSEAFVGDVAEELVNTQMVRIIAGMSALVSLGTVTDVTTNPFNSLLESYELLPSKQVLEELTETVSYDNVSEGR